jgi:2-polyprenyl-6-methoxyphenol hydroxylase-like FAD-dependent oxidoreductase
VIVVGGRVAGASTALLLARVGARVALVERTAYGADTVSTHAFMRAGVLQLSRWGLLDQVVAAGTPPIRATTFHYSDGESVEVAIRPSHGVDALYAPRRPLIDGILVDAAAEAGAHIRHGTTETGLLRDDSGRVRGVRTQDRSGRTADLSAAITVGADGIRSAVADQVAAPFLRHGRFSSATLYRYYTGVETTQYEWAYGANSAAGLIPTNDGLTCVFVSCTPARLRALRREGTEGAFDMLLARAAPGLTARVAAARPAGRMHGWAGHPGFLRLSRGAGWALVGDAGYFKDPLTTHGMTDAVRDAELLSDGILESLTGVASEAAALARYQATRDRLSRRLFDATEAVASYAWDLGEVRTLVRDVSAAMADEVKHLEALPERRVGGGAVAAARPKQARF